MIKKAITTVFILLTTLSGFTQKDTVKVVAYEKYDTARAYVLYPGENNSVKYTHGYIILKGFASKDKDKWYWTEKPVIHAVLDDKKRLLKEVLQIL